MRKLIKHILQESSKLSNIINVIKDEGIFVAAEMVGGINNLKRMLKQFPDLTDMIDSLKGKLDLLGHFKNNIIEFPFEFEVVGIAKNIHETNSWPILNLIYDDSKLNESDKKLLEQFIYSSIADLNIGKFDIKPEVRNMYKDGYYVSIDFVNGKNWESLDHDIKYNYNDIRNLHREYYTKSYMNESKTLQENEEDPTQKILNFLRRRYKVEERNFGDEEKPIIFKTIFFDVNGETYTISTFQNKREQIRVITDMLDLHNVIEPIDPYERQFDPYAQKVIRAVKTFLNQVM
jgi:hypothetical protein